MCAPEYNTFLMQRLCFQLDSVLVSVGPARQHRPSVPQSHECDVVAAAVRPAVLHALVSLRSPTDRMIREPMNDRGLFLLRSHFLAAASQHLSPEQLASSANQPGPQSQRPEAGRANPEVQMNAQGGEVLNEEELNRDWLDWVYTLSRAGILLSIVYFYSSFSRFVMVMMAMLVLYL